MSPRLGSRKAPHSFGLNLPPLSKTLGVRIQPHIRAIYSVPVLFVPGIKRTRICALTDTTSLILG